MTDPTPQTSTPVSAVTAVVTTAVNAIFDILKRESGRYLMTLIPAGALIAGSTPLAQLMNEPALAPWALFAGLAMFGAALSHMLRKVLFPYIDLESSAQKAAETPQGSGLVFLGVCVVLAAFVMTMSSLVRAQTIPPNALGVIPVLKSEQVRLWSSMAVPHYLAGQVEIESCVSLKSPRCWSPTAELKTSREQGVGLGQITRTARMDSLSDLRARYRGELGAWAWDSPTLYDPKYQVRAIVLMDMNAYQKLTAATEDDRLAKMFAAYNGGVMGVMADEKLCSATPACDRTRWWGNVERTSLKSKVALSGYGRSFYEINRAYPREIMRVRSEKYRMLWEATHVGPT